MRRGFVTSHLPAHPSASLPRLLVPPPPCSALPIAIPFYYYPVRSPSLSTPASHSRGPPPQTALVIKAYQRTAPHRAETVAAKPPVLHPPISHLPSQTPLGARHSAHTSPPGTSLCLCGGCSREVASTDFPVHERTPDCLDSRSLKLKTKQGTEARPSVLHSKLAVINIQPSKLFFLRPLLRLVPQIGRFFRALLPSITAGSKHPPAQHPSFSQLPAGLRRPPPFLPAILLRFSTPIRNSNLPIL